MSVEFHRESPGKFDSRTLSRETLSRWTGRIAITTIAQSAAITTIIVMISMIILIVIVVIVIAIIVVIVTCKPRRNLCTHAPGHPRPHEATRPRTFAPGHPCTRAPLISSARLCIRASMYLSVYAFGRLCICASMYCTRGLHSGKAYPDPDLAA